MDPVSGDVVRPLLRNRGDVATCGLALHKLLMNRGLLMEAFKTQERLNRFTNRWIESITRQPFDCLQDTLLAFVWRMRTAQAVHWDLTSRTVEATNLLRRTLAESQAPKAGTREDSEW